MDLEKELIEYYDITLDLMNKIKIEGNRLYLLKRREEILEKIKNSNFDLNHIKDVFNRLEIEKLEKELHLKVKEEMSSIKQEMQKLKRSKKGNQAYITAGYGNYVTSVFDKKY